MIKIGVRMRHPGRIRLNAAAWKDQQRTPISQMPDGFPHYLHSSGYVIWIRGKNSVLTYMWKMFKEGNITDDDLIARTVDVRGDDDRINRGRMVGGDYQRPAGWNILHPTG